MTAYTQRKNHSDIMAKCCVVVSQSPFEDLTAFRIRHVLLLVSILTSNAPGQWSNECPSPFPHLESMVNTVGSLVWELVCIRALSLAHCSSSWGSVTQVPHWCAMGASLCWWPGTHRRHPEGAISKLKAWEAGMESKGLHVNEVQRHHWLTGECLELHLPQV